MSNPTSDDTFRIFSNEEPPLAYWDEHQNLVGYSVEVVRAIQKEMGDQSDIIIHHPWIRAYRTALKEPNVVIFSAARTPERENKFHWITLLSRNLLTFYTLEETDLDLKTIDDLHHINSIAVLRGGVREKFLEDHGFTNLTSTSNHSQALKMLSSKRVDALLLYPSGLRILSKQNHHEKVRFNARYSFRLGDAYLAISKKTPLRLVQKWQKAAQTIKENGTFEVIAQRWQAKLLNDYSIDSHIQDGGLNLWNEKNTAPVIQ
ncbi:substrate-binding periplasmic protein [Marinibactrum halimedae]|uniref:Solute-binding protein family 3/N-terminal domain-containing protein n=1 Tax=Marinibactrum halimedae TaxID=1444977 RepID=A0AA37TB10_9GAMM|nr:transporter substrate-binding domain-containing protein [Marinibactrum halimedae]MCD9459454.1 transporter substrate-binding domain-containing protein [Marinibactrum halimedae]GLS28108.1 hypothetical protein GCM10007877_38270 [Marinibactrum halimedae]